MIKFIQIYPDKIHFCDKNGALLLNWWINCNKSDPLMVKLLIMLQDFHKFFDLVTDAS